MSGVEEIAAIAALASAAGGLMGSGQKGSSPVAPPTTPSVSPPASNAGLVGSGGGMNPQMLATLMALKQQSQPPYVGGGLPGSVPYGSGTSSLSMNV